MILRRLALFLALLFGFGATQLPEFVQQYQQGVAVAIGELDAIISSFDSRVAQHGLSETAGIEHLLKNSDAVAQGEGAQMQENVIRLARLRDAQEAFRSGAPVTRLATLATHYDPRIGNIVLEGFKPAVPTSVEALVLGAVGFLVGGGAVHVAGRPFRRRRERAARPVETTA